MAIFDRFIRYEWAERALELAVQHGSHQSLQNWLIEQGLGTESASRTRNLLSRLWFDVNSSSSKLRADALDLSAALMPKEVLALHWGMAIVQFPVFRETANVIGRLGFLQQEFNKAEIIGRVLEKHSNQTTIRRAVERAIQTMVNWSVLDMTSKSVYRFSTEHSIFSSALAEWLFRSVMIVYPDKYWLLPDLLGSAELFPFDLLHHNITLYQSQYFTIERDSSGVEIIGIRPN